MMGQPRYPQIRLCFVCRGNICRSPTAEGIMKSLLNAAGFHKQISVDSAGMESYHVGQRADSRAYEMAQARGVILDSRARQFTIDDFAEFDYVLAMDHVNRDELLELAPDKSAREKSSCFDHLMLQLHPRLKSQIPIVAGEQAL